MVTDQSAPWGIWGVGGLRDSFLEEARQVG